MQITFLGGADEVGASCLLIEIAGRRLLVDAGIRPTPKARWGLAGDQLPDLREIERRGGIDAILVTHAHTDHTGALELVCERYPGVPLYATPVTGELTRVLHQDAQRIMRARLEEEGELPLFDEVATARLLAAFTPVPFHQPLTLAPGLTATFFPAGHIAGAAMIGLASAEGRILISGDISISPQRTVDGARPPAFKPDVLILESTYGGRLHANRAVEEQRLVETVAAVTAAGGKVLIPAFALGRAQELLLTLGEFLRRGALAPVPVWADGMVRAICQAYASFPDALPLALQEQGAAFFDANIQPVTSAAQRNALIWEPGPAVIVSSSGMLAGGPAQAYARALAGQPQHAILLTGYQDEESPGRRLQEMAARGRGTLRLGKDKVDVQCRLATYSLSAHADSGQLVSFVETLDPTQVFLVHGDEEARTSLAAALRARGRRVRLPRAGQTFGFQFTPVVRPQTAQGLGRGQRLDLRRLWELVVDAPGVVPGVVPGDELADEGADTALVTLDDLARTWWGDQPGPTAAQLASLATLLGEDTRYFVADPERPDTYRLRSRAAGGVGGTAPVPDGRVRQPGGTLAAGAEPGGRGLRGARRGGGGRPRAGGRRRRAGAICGLAGGHPQRAGGGRRSCGGAGAHGRGPGSRWRSDHGAEPGAGFRPRALSPHSTSAPHGLSPGRARARADVRFPRRRTDAVCSGAGRTGRTHGLAGRDHPRSKP